MLILADEHRASIVEFLISININVVVDLVKEA